MALKVQIPTKSLFQKLESVPLKAPQEYGLTKTRAVFLHNNQKGCNGHPEEYDIPAFSFEDEKRLRMEFKPSPFKMPSSEKMSECLDIAELQKKINQITSFSDLSLLSQLKPFVKTVPQYAVKDLWLPTWLAQENSAKKAFETRYFSLLDGESLCIAMNSPNIADIKKCPSNPNRTKKINDPSIAKFAIQDPIIAYPEQWQRQLLQTDKIQKQSALLMLRKNIYKAEKQSFMLSLRSTTEEWLNGIRTTKNPFTVNQIKSIIRGNADKFTEEERSTVPYAVSNQEIIEWKAKFQRD